MSTHEENLALANDSDRIAELWERAIHLNGSGARAIRDLTQAVRNYEQADQHAGLIADRFERLVTQMDGLLTENLSLQKEVVKLFRRVSKLEAGANEARGGTSG